VALRDQGKRDEAAKLFQENVAEIQEYAKRWASPRLRCRR
jgi:hypothetical protein